MSAYGRVGAGCIVATVGLTAQAVVVAVVAILIAAWLLCPPLADAIERSDW